MANYVILIGNVGEDPQIKEFDWGKVANLRLATTERGYTTKAGKEVPSTTDWHNVVVKNGLAGVIEKFVRKGSKLYVGGKITYRSWEAKDGTKKYITEIVAEDIELLDKKESNQQVNVPQQQYQPQPQFQAQPQQPTQQQLTPQDDGLPF